MAFIDILIAASEGLKEMQHLKMDSLQNKNGHFPKML